VSKIILIGSPNSGKSLLFNKLTGLHQKVANFPGITVDIAIGKLLKMNNVSLIDYPGTYSLQPISGEEQVATRYFTQALDDREVTHVFCIIDITRLEKSLYFTLQVIRECARYGKKVLVLANMMDVLQKHKVEVDLEGLSRAINAPIIGISGRSGSNLDKIVDWVRDSANHVPKPNQGLVITPDEILRGTAHQLAHQYGPKGDILVKSQTRLDSFFLHSGIGAIAFLLIMYLLFQSIFTWAAPAMDAVEAVLAAIADFVVPLFGATMARDFMSDAIFSGIGAFLVFVPQIFVLTLVIGILEDSGYLARAALICHKPLRLFGLTGKSFIPILSGVACAIPGIYAARSIDSPRKRLLTYMAIPLMPCSARLPVYTLLIAAFIPNTTALGGLVGLQGLAMFFIYFFGMFCALLVTGLISRTRKDRFTDLPFVLEMPPYRIPAWQPLLRNAWNRSKHFVTKAGTVIFCVTLAIWVLGYFPNQGVDLRSSWLGQIGHVIEPVFAPLGLDWRYGVAILTSFLAREVFVGTLGTMFGIENADEHMTPLVDQIQSSGLPIASGLALLVFFAISLMCVSTLAILRKESNSRAFASRLFIAYGLWGYVAALITYQIAIFFFS